MLTKEDLQAISELINGAVSASENRIMAYIESDVKKEIRQIADGHKQLAEKMDRMEQKIDKIQDSVDEIKGELTTQESNKHKNRRPDIFLAACFFVLK